jgi:hypothetical protein
VTVTERMQFVSVPVCYGRYNAVTYHIPQSASRIAACKSVIDLELTKLY